MPVLSRFYGIVAKMYFLGGEHNPPYVHFIYGEYVGAVEIRTRRMMEGDLPPKALAMAQEWTALHEAELLDIWESQNFRQIPPLE